MDRHVAEHDDMLEEIDVAMEAPPLVRFDERRMHVRAYNYWASLLGDRTFPSIEDLNPEEIEDFGSHSVLLDFTNGVEDPVVAFLGSALLKQSGATEEIKRISDIPQRTVLSRLTDHYMQIIANEAPIGFEAEFTDRHGAEILYRGILMPFSSDDDTIDFVYGVINWKEVASAAMTREIEAAVAAMLPVVKPEAALAPVWEDGPSQSRQPTAEPAAAADPFDRALADARQAAADALSAEGRTRQALYRALGLAHDFALAAQARPDDYASQLAGAGITVQPRNPMTALAKLVFGADYDKTRLSEFATVIDHGIAIGLAEGALTDHIAGYPGGLKALVRDARRARKPDTASTSVDRDAAARLRLSAAPISDLATIPTDEAGYAVIVVRRQPDGSFDPIGGIAGDDRRAGAILRAVADQL